MTKFLTRHIGAFCALILLLVCAGIAQARPTACDPDTPNNAICISWSAVTADTNGNAITGVTYRTERSSSATGSFTALGTGSDTKFYAKNLTTGTHYFRVIALCTSCTGESSPSNVASGSATPIPVIPATPSIIIAATIRADGPPVYRIIQSVNLKPNEVVFAAPAAMRPLFANR